MAMRLDLDGFAVIYPTGWNDDYIAGVHVFKRETERIAKFYLTLKNDCCEGRCAYDNSDKELLLGKVNRRESQTACLELSSLNAGECFIRFTPNKIVILGKDDEATFKGMKYFLNVLLLKDGGVVEETLIKIKTDTESTFIYPFFAEWKVQRQSDIYECTEQFPREQCTYGKILKIEHCRARLGYLYCTREAEGGANDEYPVYESRDDGASWELVSRIRDENHGGFTAGWQPFLWELSEDIGCFTKGTVLVAGCSRKFVGKECETIITLYYSEDGCRTWKQFADIDGAGRGHGALWEPLLTFDAETKRMYCFYSDDTQEGYNQKLCYKYSYDLVDWIGDESREKRGNGNVYPFDCVACGDENARPGMITIAKMGNGEYFTAFEAVGYGEWCQIYYKKARALDGWDISDGGKVVMTRDGKSFGSGPCVAWTPRGGECGTLIVVAAHMVTGSKRTEADLFLSFDYGETFVAVENPVVYKHGEKNRCGYSCGFYVDKAGAIYYVADKDAKRYAEDFIFTKIEID